MDIEARITVKFAGGQVTFEGTSLDALLHFTTMAKALSAGGTATPMIAITQTFREVERPAAEVLKERVDRAFPTPEPAKQTPKTKVEQPPKVTKPKAEKPAEPVAPTNGKPVSAYVTALNKCSTLMEVIPVMRAHGVADEGLAYECERLREQVHALGVVKTGAFADRIPRLLARLNIVEADAADAPVVDPADAL